MNVLKRLRTLFAAATPPGGDSAAFSAAVRPSTDPKFGDYQANGCMALANAAKTNPRVLAQSVVEIIDLQPLADKPEIAGPGFLNVRLREDWVSKTLGELLADENLGIIPAEKPLKVVIDYSSPNVAKPMHVGHIRSTVIGESLARIYQALGHSVVRDNHLGDWGSQFGMILWGWKHEKDLSSYEANPVGELSRLYRAVQGRIRRGEELKKQYAKVFALEDQGRSTDADALFNNLYDGSGLTRAEVHDVVGLSRKVADEARQETAKLHAGDPKNRDLWQKFIPECLGALQGVYDRLGVKFDVFLGESFYDPMLADVVSDLEAKGLAVPSEGATVVFLDGFKTPLMIRKSDGAFNYATTDLAKVKYIEETYHPDLSLYVVDHRQSDHFQAVFAASRKWGYKADALVHVAFGTILDKSRHPYKTRAGDVIGLESLLDEAVAEALKVLKENSPDLDEAEQARVAEVVGLGAIKYADLSQNRLSDYVFDWDKMLAMNGNTGAYLQYAYARAQSIFRKGEITPEAIRGSQPEIVLNHSAERALGVAILRLPEVMELAAAEWKPNVLTDYLFDLANKFSSFFEGCPVLKAESPERKASRLALCDLTARTLRFGLNLLGIAVVDRM